MTLRNRLVRLSLLDQAAGVVAGNSSPDLLHLRRKVLHDAIHVELPVLLDEAEALHDLEALARQQVKTNLFDTVLDRLDALRAVKRRSQ